jgi:hypothetical protein
MFVVTWQYACNQAYCLVDSPLVMPVSQLEGGTLCTTAQYMRHHNPSFWYAAQPRQWDGCFGRCYDPKANDHLR